MEADATRLRIRAYPDPILRTVGESIPVVDEGVRSVALRMLELMRGAQGVGLAAPQVGLPWRLFVAEPWERQEGDSPAGPLVYINPVLSTPSRETEEADEGCLSIPDVQAAIRRPTAITVEALDLEGNPFEVRSEGFAARVWQHEVDHLDGVLILDRMNAIDRRANKSAIRALEADG